MIRRSFIALLVLVALCILLARTDAAAATTAASRKPSTAAPQRPQPIPDFEPFSPEEEEELINGPARVESTPGTSHQQQQVQAPPILLQQTNRASPTPTTATLPIVSLDVSGDMKLVHLCQQLPLSPRASASAGGSSMALAYLSQLLRALWVGSGLLDAGAGDHLLQVRVLDTQRQLLEASFRSSAPGGDAALLREEDLPELFEASMGMLRTLDVDLEAEARLDLARGEGVGWTDEFSPHLSATGKASFWNVPLQALLVLGLHPTTQDEVDAFWALVCMFGLACAALGIGYACGQRSRGGTSLAQSVDESINGPSSSASASAAAARRASRRARWAIVGWLFLVLVILACLAAMAGIYQEYGEERRRLVTLQSLAKTKGPPRGCRVGEEVGWWKETWHALRGGSERDDPCVQYMEKVERSTRPDPLHVALTYFARNTLVLFARAAGDSMAGFLGTQTYGTQMLMLTFLLGLGAIAMALGGPAAVVSIFCCCGRGGSGGNGGSNKPRESSNARVRGGSTAARIRAEERKAAASARYAIESGTTDSEDESEAETSRRAREDRALVQALKRLGVGTTSSSSTSSSSSSRDAPRLTAPRRHRNHSRSRSRSHSPAHSPPRSSSSSSAVAAPSSSNSQSKSKRKEKESSSSSKSPSKQQQQQPKKGSTPSKAPAVAEEVDTEPEEEVEQASQAAAGEKAPAAASALQQAD